MSSKVLSVTLGGVLGALAVLVMLLCTPLGIATYIGAMLAGLCLFPVRIECGIRLACISFAAAGVLALILIPDKEMAFCFLFLFGYYPILKETLDHIRNRIVSYLLKLAVFNVSVIGMYFLLLKIIALESVIQDFSENSGSYMMVLLLLGNFTFLIYDRLLNMLQTLYWKKIRPKFRGGNESP